MPITTGTRVAAHCDFVRVGVLEQAGGAPRVEITGRIWGTGSTCAVLESIELTDGGTPIQVIDASGMRVRLEDQNATWGVYEAAAELVAPCSTEEGRLEPFGVIVRGSGDMGPFEARCGRGVEAGSGWPPRVFRTCSEGLSHMPTEGNSLVMPAGMFALTMGYFSIRHDPGEAIETVSGDIRVLAYNWTFGGPIEPRDTTGWNTSAYEGMFLDWPASQVSLNSSEDLLGSEICPVSCDVIADPTCDPSPVWLGRMTGTSTRGPFRTEVLFSMCTRPRPAP